MEKSSSQGKKYESYKKVSTLGVGSFGTAYLVSCASDKMLAVIKQIDIGEMTEDERKETLKEAKILEVLNHPNITRFREVYKTKKGKLCIVMDYCDDGDLQTKIKSQTKVKDSQGKTIFFNEEQVLNWFTQICLAIKHTHDKKILHRDLKSQNIFMTKRGILKLGDFGIARVLSNTKSRAKTVVGTPYYLSPEIIQSQGYSFKSDIWSLGVLLYEIAALQPPFNAASLHQLAQKIIQGKYNPLPSTFSKATTQLVASLLQKDPGQRPTIHQILKMPQIQPRIAQFLQGETFKDEFAHTILHNQDVFEEFRRIQNAMKQEQEQKAQLEEAKRKISANQGAYNPPQQYLEKHQDPAFFNYQYSQYYEHLTNEKEVDKAYGAPLKSLVQPEEDREEDTGLYSKQNQSSESGSQRPSTSHEVPLPTGAPVTQQDMINITSCDLSQFAVYMSGQYGQVQFKQGFEIIKQQQDLIYAENGEDQLIERLRHLFQSDDQIRSFINFCTTFLIVQNMQFGV